MKKRLILIIALILGLVSSITVYQFLEIQEGGPVAQQELVPVVVAAKGVEPRQRITIDQVQIKKFPREMVHFEAATRVDEVIGFFARDQFIEGEQILKPKLIKGFEDYGIVIKIPAGRRAMTIPVDPVVGVAGFVRPGDYVDIIAGFNELIMGENIAKILLQKVLVLATDQELSEDQREPVESGTVTVAVTLEEAEKLALALDHGVVRVALRPLENSPIEPVKDMTAANLIPKSTAPAKTSGTTKTSEKPLSQLSNPPKPQPAKASATSANPVQTSSTSEKISNPGPYTVEVIRGTERSTVTVEVEEEVKR